MRRALGILVAVAVMALPALLLAQKAPAPPGGAAAKSTAKSAPAANPRAADEKAVRGTADAFAKAYNAHDAKALAALFVTDGEIINAEGDVIHGRAAIEKVFAGGFDEQPNSQITVAIDSVRFLTPVLAIEEGSTSQVDEPGAPPDLSRYTVLHVKQQDGKWLMANARDLSIGNDAEEELKQLEWMVGDWIDESPDSLVATSTHWTDNHAFLLSEFTIHIQGRPVLNGSQRIGWDPLAKVIRSWLFDSQGGFAEGVYSRNGDQWMVKLRGVTRDGEPTTATNVITRVSKDQLTWQSRDRTLGGEADADTEEIVIVRQPPKPKLAP